MRLNGKVAIVTGAYGGIGLATAEAFAGEGATVYAADVAFADAATTSNGIRQRHVDVTDLGSWSALADEILVEHGGVDVLVNNAGLVGSYESITDIDIERWHDIVSVNQTGVFYGMRTAIPLLRARGGGAIVNISSIWGIVGAAGVAAYQASKGAVTR
jgi:NAD(P)-dependent dehydrogenase (short-subunit alcohol dehydrogenase family)